jgi:hypothetical protein
VNRQNTYRIRQDVEISGCTVILHFIGRLWRGTEEGHEKAVKIKIYVYKTMLNPAAVFGSETWTVAEMDMNSVGTWDRKILRINGLVVEQGIWRIRTDQELREICKDLDIVAGIKKKRSNGLDM